MPRKLDERDLILKEESTSFIRINDFNYENNSDLILRLYIVKKLG